MSRSAKGRTISRRRERHILNKIGDTFKRVGNIARVNWGDGIKLNQVKERGVEDVGSD